MDPHSTIREGDKSNVTLSCDVEDGNPSVLTRVQWFMDMILLQVLPQCETVSSLCDVDPTKLLLESVNRHFYGNFSCIGINSATSLINILTLHSVCFARCRSSTQDV